MGNRRSQELIFAGKRILILCEGDTEERYFNGLKSHDDNKRKLQGVKAFKPTDTSPQGLVKEAKRLILEAKKQKRPYDYVWVVFDKDKHPLVHQAYSDADTCNTQPPIKIGFANRCFEYFVLLHYTYTTRAFDRCDDILTVLKQHMPDYEKADADLYDILYPNKHIGIANSKRVLRHVQNDMDRGVKEYDLSVYCNIHEIVEFLEGLVQE